MHSTVSSNSKSRSRRASALVTLAAAVGLLLLGSSLALAHTAFFTIWGTGIYIWTGQTDHYNNDFCGPNCPYDYMIPMNAQVYQSGTGDFTWTYLDLPAGNEFTNGAFKGDMYLVGYSGQIATSGAYFCTRVTQAVAYNLEAVLNGGPTGYWQQDSGGGSSSCYLTYGPVQDKQAVQAH